MKLNVGCGGNKKYSFKDFNCDVNLDVKLPETKIKNFVRGDAEHLPFCPSTFDEIYASHIIEHLDSPQRFVSGCFRVLRNKGVIHIWTPNFLSADVYLDPTHKHSFNFLSLKKIFEKKKNFIVRFTPNIRSMIPPSMQSNRIFKIFFRVFRWELYATAEKRDAPL